MKFLAYLRGIETQIGTMGKLQMEEFLAYLRGIETYITSIR